MKHYNPDINVTQKDIVCEITGNPPHTHNSEMNEDQDPYQFLEHYGYSNGVYASSVIPYHVIQEEHKNEWPIIVKVGSDSAAQYILLVGCNIKGKLPRHNTEQIEVYYYDPSFDSSKRCYADNAINCTIERGSYANHKVNCAYFVKDIDKNGDFIEYESYAHEHILGYILTHMPTEDSPIFTPNTDGCNIEPPQKSDWFWWKKIEKEKTKI